MALNSPQQLDDEQDAEYWFDDRLKVFKVEKRLFRVSMGKLMKESELFYDLFSNASPDIDSIRGEEGSSAQHPILIAGETIEAFTMLLQWVYKRETINWTKDGWIEALRIAHKFRIVSLTKASMEFLSKSPMSPYERIRLCDAFHLDWNWAREAIAELCNQLESLPARTNGQQQIPFWLRMEILEVRELLWKRNLGRNDFEVYCVECGIMRRLYGDQRAYCKHGKITLMQKMDMALVDKILETRK